MSLAQWQRFDATYWVYTVTHGEFANSSSWQENAQRSSERYRGCRNSYCSGSISIDCTMRHSKNIWPHFDPDHSDASQRPETTTASEQLIRAWANSPFLANIVHGQRMSAERTLSSTGSDTRRNESKWIEEQPVAITVMHKCIKAVNLHQTKSLTRTLDTSSMFEPHLNQRNAS